MELGSQQYVAAQSEDGIRDMELTVAATLWECVAGIVLLGCWVTGLLDYWTTGLLGYWATGLLGYWATGLLDY